ncbi:SDR family NAD(P)-dependent oxidoreductase [Bradyrhizobium japonicum]|jgi:NAD(P)-dependent dehydrogenase (short-subunit alcohol dehydrogenase family)|uniref:SDR family NAD(P)-dependent oxidoreductase n=2 Tax=Bradyrhizobium TaxID=374 RepID=UPI00041DBD9D|nr:SDR family oxidoreductase [Bradyrhizobium japonicum]
MRKGQIIVTGASRGIGRSIALELDRRGFAVAGLSRSGATAAGTGYACDMTSESAISGAIAKIALEGPVIGLVNNAGAHEAKRTVELSLSDFEATMRLNASAVMVACRESYPHLKLAGDSLIVNIGSFFDKLAVIDNLAYCASKAAVGAITRCLAAEWARDGIRVLDVAPGYIETDLNRDFLASDKVRAWLKRRVPVGRAGSPDEVARLVGALYAENIAFLTGETIYIDGCQGANH